MFKKLAQVKNKHYICKRKIKKYMKEVSDNNE